MKIYICISFIAVSFFLLFLSLGLSQDDKTIEKLQEKQRQLEKLSEDASSWSAKQHAISRDRFNACVNAFGNEEFCSCLNAKLHWVLNFESYITIITSSQKEISKNIDADNQLLIDSVYKAREICVKETFKIKRK